MPSHNSGTNGKPTNLTGSFVPETLVEIFSEGTLFAGKEELEQEVIKMGGRLNSINKVLGSIEKLNIDDQTYISDASMKRLSFDNHVSRRSEI